MRALCLCVCVHACVHFVFLLREIVSLQEQEVGVIKQVYVHDHKNVTTVSS